MYPLSGRGRYVIMKKIIFSLICFMALVFVSCSGDVVNNTENDNRMFFSDVARDISSLTDFRADISSSTNAVGLASEYTGAKGLDDAEDLILVKMDEGDTEVTPVTFEATQETVFNGKSFKAGDILTQDDLGVVDKVYVLGDCILVSYLTFDVKSLVSQFLSYKDEYPEYTQYYGDLFLDEEMTKPLHFLYSVYSDNSKADSFYFTYQTFNDDGTRKTVDERVVLRCEYNNDIQPNELNGLSYYDTFDYYSSFFRQSFIIDTKSGLIYEIPDKTRNGNSLELSVHQGVVFDAQLGPVDLTVNNNGELEITQLLENQSLWLHDAFRDRYGQYYICCESLDEIDYEKNILFYSSPGEYVPIENGIVVHMNVESQNIAPELQYPMITGMNYVGADFSETPVPSDEFISFAYNTIEHNFWDYNVRQQNTNTMWSGGTKVIYLYYSDNVLYSYDPEYNRFFADDFTSGIIRYVSFAGFGINVSCYSGILDGLNTAVAYKMSGENSYSLYVVDNLFDALFPSWEYGSFGYVQNGKNYPSIHPGDSDIDDYSSFAIEYADEVEVDGNFYYNGKQYKYKDGYDDASVGKLYFIHWLGTPISKSISSIATDSKRPVRSGYDMVLTVKSRTGTDNYRIVRNEGSYGIELASSVVSIVKTVTLQPIFR